MDTRVTTAPELEACILSCINLEPEKYITAAITAGLTPAHFYIPAHRILFETYVRRYNNRWSCDIQSLTNELQKRGELEQCGGYAGIIEILTKTITGAAFHSHVTAVKEAHLRRSLIELCTNAAAAASDPRQTADTLLSGVESALYAIRNEGTENKDRTWSSILHSAVDRIEKLIRTGGRPDGLLTGFPTLDRHTGGLHSGDLFVIAARPSMGKTALMLNIADTIAKHGHVLIFSLEMTDDQLAERVIYGNSGVGKNQIIRNGGITKEDAFNLGNAVKALKQRHFTICDLPAMSITAVQAYARRVKYSHQDLCCICIDYLQLMRSQTTQAKTSREREVADISSGLKRLAKELSLPVIVLSQLNRSAETRTGKDKGVPMMSDLRESGAIEQDADMIGLLYRPAYYLPDSDPEKAARSTEARLILSKNRNGEVGTINLEWNAPTMTFTEPAYTPEPELL